MKYVNQKIKSTMLATFALCVYSTLGLVSLSVSAASVEGLELLNGVGKHPAKLSVYHAPELSPKEIARLKLLGERMADAARVKLGEPFNLGLDESRMAFKGIEDPSATLEIDRFTGSFLFSSGRARYRDDGDTKNLPAESEAAALAQRALEKYELAVDETQLQLAHVGGLNMGVTTGAGDSTVYEKLRSVKFGRVIDGLAVEGDSRIVVQLAEDGELAGLVYQWPELKADLLSSSQLQKPEVIKERALEQIHAVVDRAKRSELTLAELVLYDDGKGVVEPAYHFVIERYFDYGNLKEATMIPFDFYVPVTLEPLAFYPFMEEAPQALGDEADKK